MKFFKRLLKDLRGLSNLYPLSKWLMRIFLLIYVFETYKHRFQDPSLESEYFWLAVIYFTFSILLFLGGFGRNSDLTRVSALVLFITAVIHLSVSLLVYKRIDEFYASKLLFFGIILYFLTSSKWQERQAKGASSEGIFDEKNV